MGGHLLLDLRIEEAQRIAAGRLGLIHREVGAFQEFGGVVLVLAEERHADAWRAVMHMAIQVIRQVQRSQDFFADPFGLQGSGDGLLAEFFEQHDEFVATDARHGIAVAHAARQPTGDLLQQQIALVMAEAVIEQLEVVEVDEHQRALARATQAGRQRAPQTIHQQAPVRQFGERIKKCQVADFFFGGLAQRDVALRTDVVSNPAVDTTHAGDAHPGRIDFTVLAPVPDFAVPRAIAQDAVVHRCIKRRVMTSRFQDGWRLAEDVGIAVAGHFGKGPIDPQDREIRIRDHHGFVRMEGGSGDAPVFVGVLAIGNVMQCQMQQAVLRDVHHRVIEGGRCRHHDINEAAIAATQLQLDIRQVISGKELFERRAGQGTTAAVAQHQRALPDDVVAGIAGHVEQRLVAVDDLAADRISRHEHVGRLVVQVAVFVLGTRAFELPAMEQDAAAQQQQRECREDGAKVIAEAQLVHFIDAEPLQVQRIVDAVGFGDRQRFIEPAQ
ncbi:hypothetical protein IMCC9480_2969 [Oxalobacteraceae bacterium IMCC9480]|nr:hypothetical protein IMCC9480_2969 [Oxalobacteraceae bacterium IMCC9480]